LQNAVQISKHLVIPEPDHAVAFRRQLLSTTRIGFDRIRMLPAIDFNHELACGYREVCDVTTDRMLSADLVR
jgi:hypothetical protein